MEPSISYRITQGKQAGTVCAPHKHSYGRYIVSKTRYQQDYINLESLSYALNYLHY